MVKTYTIYFFPRDESHPTFVAAMTRLKQAGYRIGKQRHEPRHYRVTSPHDDVRWRPEIEALADQLLIRFLDVHEDVEYEDHELEDIGLFSFCLSQRTEVEIPLGSDHILGFDDIADWDETRMCPTCGAGVVQSSSARIPAAALARKSLIADTGLAYGPGFFFSESLRQALQSEHGIELPVREVQQTGRKAPKERWWQVLATMVLPETAFVKVNIESIACETCGEAVWKRVNDQLESALYTSRKGFALDSIDSVVLSPDRAGEVIRGEDGRLLKAPIPQVWLRGDLARALRRLAPGHIELLPFQWR